MYYLVGITLSRGGLGLTGGRAGRGRAALSPERARACGGVFEQNPRMVERKHQHAGQTKQTNPGDRMKATSSTI